MTGRERILDESDATKRAKRLLSGLMVTAGLGSCVGAFVAAAHGIHGYGDVFAFLAALMFSAIFVVIGWVWSSE